MQRDKGYEEVMLRRFLQRLVFLVTLVAFLSAGISQAMPSAAAMAPPEKAMTMSLPMAMDAGIEGAQAPCKDPAPCQERLSGCMLDLGCIFLVGLPIPSTLTATLMSWSTITYWGRSDEDAGRSHKPALGPPILLV